MSCHSHPQMDIPSTGTAQLIRLTPHPPAQHPQETCEGQRRTAGRLTVTSPSAIPTGQRALPRGLSGTEGSAGAGSGAPPYPFTSPNRVPSIQSLRACSISPCDRPIQFQNKWNRPTSTAGRRAWPSPRPARRVGVRGRRVKESVVEPEVLSAPGCGAGWRAIGLPGSLPVRRSLPHPQAHSRRTDSRSRSRHQSCRRLQHAWPGRRACHASALTRDRSRTADQCTVHHSIRLGPDPHVPRPQLHSGPGDGCCPIGPR